MLRFSIFGIPVVVHPYFWITMALIGGAIGARTPDAMFRLLLFLLAGFISVLVHELGHALTARKFGAWCEIVLHGLGGYASYSGVRMTRPQTFAITAAGPLAQIALGAAVYFSLPSLRGNVAPNGMYFALCLTWISIVWAVFNLLPVLPLDGGRMLDSLLGPSRVRITLWTTIITAVTVGLALIKVSILVPIFMAFFAWQAWKTLREGPWR